jgi:hypothetical protein
LQTPNSIGIISKQASKVIYGEEKQKVKPEE